MQAVHLLVAGVVAVSGLAIALRALGWRFIDQPFGEVWRRFAPWLGWGLGVMLVTGLAQTLGDPVREFTATSYWLKLCLLACCVAGTLLLGRRLRPAAATRSINLTLVAIALVLCWLAIVLLGRMIAYDQAFWGRWSLRA